MNIEQKLLEYEFNRLVFGVNLSPFLAQFVSRYHAKMHKKQYPSHFKLTYMDDSMCLYRGEDESILREQPNSIHLISQVHIYQKISIYSASMMS